MEKGKKEEERLGPREGSGTETEIMMAGPWLTLISFGVLM